MPFGNKLILPLEVETISLLFTSKSPPSWGEVSLDRSVAARATKDEANTFFKLPLSETSDIKRLSPLAAVTLENPVTAVDSSWPLPTVLSSGVNLPVSLSLWIAKILFVPFAGAEVNVIILG